MCERSIAQICQQIEQDICMVQRRGSAPVQHVVHHALIRARMERVELCHYRLAAHIGASDAHHIIDQRDIQTVAQDMAFDLTPSIR